MGVLSVCNSTICRPKAVIWAGDSDRAGPCRSGRLLQSRELPMKLHRGPTSPGPNSGTLGAGCGIAPRDEDHPLAALDPQED